MNRTTTLLAIGLLAGAPHAAFAAESTCSAKSGEYTTALIELYTSEGCSSCPPADEWLAALPQHQQVPEKVVPLALHVDYWNHLGWIDPFAQKKFSDRQSRRTFLNRKHTVYTPQVVINGHVLPRWRQQAGVTIPLVNTTPAHADIALEITRDASRVDITVDAKTGNHYRGQAEIYLALYERNLVRRIGAGENSGRTLHHDYVVRALHGPSELDRNGTGRFRQRLSLDKSWKQEDLGLAAFVQNRDTGEILQTVARALCR